MEEIRIRPMGIIHSPFTDRKNMPIQPCGAGDTPGTVVVHPDLGDGLKDLDGFSHLHLLYHFHMSRGFDLTVVPFMDPASRGLFSTRAPRRPARIGLSVVRLERVEGNILHIRGVDVLDGTPLIDIKPYMRAFDCFPDAVCGWAEGCQDEADDIRSDDRFITPDS